MILKHNKSSLILPKGVMEKKVIYQRGRDEKENSLLCLWVGLIRFRLYSGLLVFFLGFTFVVFNMQLLRNTRFGVNTNAEHA